MKRLALKKAVGVGLVALSAMAAVPADAAGAAWCRMSGNRTSTDTFAVTAQCIGTGEFNSTWNYTATINSLTPDPILGQVGGVATGWASIAGGSIGGVSISGECEVGVFQAPEQYHFYCRANVRGRPVDLGWGLYRLTPGQLQGGGLFSDSSIGV